MEVEINDVRTMLEKSKLDWKVRTEGIQTVSGLEIPSGMAIVREDTKKVLSVRGDGYHPFQNEDMMELLYRVSSKTGLEVHRAGFFGEGEKVYIQLKSDDLKIGGDTIKGFLTGINSFDGSTSLAFGPTTLTISCMNTFYGAFREMTTKIRHTKNMVIRVEDVCRRLEETLKEEHEMFDNILKLSETRFDKALENKVVRDLFKLETGIDLNSTEISTRTRNQMERFYVDLNGELAQKGDNLWGLFSGVTKFTTHSIGDLRKNYESDSKMYNDYGRREQRIFNQLVELV